MWRRVARAPLLLIESTRLRVQTFPRRRSIDRRVLGAQEPLMAPLAHLGEFGHFRSSFASVGQVCAIAIACTSLWRSPLHRDAVLVAHGDGGRITAWRLAIQGAELDSNPPPTHPPPPALPQLTCLLCFSRVPIPSQSHNRLVCVCFCAQAWQRKILHCATSTSS